MGDGGTAGSGLLAPYRVLEIYGPEAALYGKVFADLGARVTKVEPPGGDPSRGLAPFALYPARPGQGSHAVGWPSPGEGPHSGGSLFWLAYNTGKESITLDITRGEGQALLKGLAARADFLAEAFPPGYLDSLGLGYEALAEVNPRLIMASITPFGQEGPYARYKGPDLVLWALGGYMYLTGEAQGPPLRISLPPQSYLHAAAMAVVGSLLALLVRLRTGRGQHVDVAAREVFPWMAAHGLAHWELERVNLRREGGWRQVGSASRVRLIYPCRDGYIAWYVVAGPVGARSLARLVAWMDEEGMAPPFLREVCWEEMDFWQAPTQVIEEILEPFAAFFRTKTKAELLEAALREDHMLAPVQTVQEILRDPQLAARGFWATLEDPNLGQAIPYPGGACRLSGSAWGPRGPAPAIGQHNREVYQGELGLSPTEVAALAEVGVI